MSYIVSNFFKVWIFLASCLFMNCAFSNPVPYLDIINVVWGKNYTDAFLKISLPLQLCPGNLGCLPKGSARYRIFTTQDDWDVMCLDPSMIKLQEMISVDFIQVDQLPKGAPWGKLTEYHMHAIRDAANEGHAVVFLSPDCLMSNNTFQSILKNAEEGNRAIMIMGIRLQKEKMIPIIETALKEKNNLHNGLNSRDLVALSVPHIHPMSASLFFDEYINQWACAVYWKLDNENLLSYGFHLHPIFVWPETMETSVRTIDDEFIFKACPSKDKWKIIQDSDEMVVFEFSGIERSYQYGPIQWMPCTPRNIALWALSTAHPNHWYYFDKPMLIHSTNYKEEWKEIEERAKDFINEIKGYAGR